MGMIDKKGVYMRTQQHDIFSNIPKQEYLNLLHNLADVPNFLDLEKDDVSKAANIAKSSVRYDSRIPADLEKLLSEIALVCEMVAHYFDGDIRKTALWFKMENPALGGISPRDMIRYGRFKKLKAFIQNQLEGDIP